VTGDIYASASSSQASLAPLRNEGALAGNKEARGPATRPARASEDVQRMIDFHNHVLPAADDGAADLPQALVALGALAAQGVDTW
jgi:hypothetical protein